MSSVVQSPNALAVNYYNDFGKIFVITEGTEGGSILCTVESMKRVEDWFNRTYLLISLITAVPLGELHFQYSDLTSTKDEAVVLNNHKLMHHIYSVSYTALLKMASIIKQEVPSSYRQYPTIHKDE